MSAAALDRISDLARRDPLAGLSIYAIPIYRSSRVIVGPCPRNACEHPASMHTRFRMGGILGDRYACEFCAADGGPCV